MKGSPVTADVPFEEVLARDAGVLERLGLRYDWHREGVCRMSATVLPEMVNAAGFAHGAMFFALADTAAAYAVRSLEVYGVTTDANMHYAKGAEAGEEIYVEATVINRSRRLASIRAEVRRLEDDRLLTHGTFTFMLLG